MAPVASGPWLALLNIGVLEQLEGPVLAPSSPPDPRSGRSIVAPRRLPDANAADPSLRNPTDEPRGRMVASPMIVKSGKARLSYDRQKRKGSTMTHCEAR